jgi:NADH-quinone oxidoreductase subunit I
VDYAKIPLETAWGQATLNPTAVAASKLVTSPVWEKKPDPPKAAEPAAATPGTSA